jgi:transcriptional regulator with XRE-family HTH domain
MPNQRAARVDTTQEEFARRVGVTQGHLSRMERAEKEPDAGVLLAISREFGKSVDWLLTGRTRVEPKKRVAKDPANP